MKFPDLGNSHLGQVPFAYCTVVVCLCSCIVVSRLPSRAFWSPSGAFVRVQGLGFRVWGIGFRV